MQTQQLRYFIAAAEELSFSRAARRCHVSQPPLSRAIALLEEEVGARLFERDTHRVSLTLAGESLYRDAIRALAIMEEGADRARQVALGLKGQLIVGLGGSTAYMALPAIIERFRLQVPDVKMVYRAMPVPDQIDGLRSGEIDVGLLRLPVHDELIETRFVHREPLLLALPRSHPAFGTAGPVALADLDGTGFVVYEPRRGYNYHADLLALCRLEGFEPTIVHMAATTEAVIGIVACGEGVAVVPASARRLRMRGVAYRAFECTNAPQNLREVSFGIAWNRNNDSTVVSEFVQRVSETPTPASDPQDIAG